MNAKTDAEDETLWLPLVVHLQDTAAVMEYLLWHWLPDDYYDELELTQEKLCKIAIAAALLHDIGKATPMFQRKIFGSPRDVAVSAGKKWTNYRTAEGLI